MFKSYKELSRINYGTEEVTTDEKIKIGCMQRIADATELLVKDHAKLIKERDNYKQWHEEERARKETLARRNIALRGVITRMKNKLAKPMKLAVGIESELSK